MSIPNTTFRSLVEKLGGTEPSEFIGNEGDLFYDPNTATLRVSDGKTPGGITVNGNGGGGESGLTEAEVLELVRNAGYIKEVEELDDIGNVSTGGATADQFLRYNGSNWVAETVPPIADTLIFQGTVDATADAAPGAPVVGWYYFNTGTGSALGSWTGLTNVTDGDRLIYSRNNEWQIAGNVSGELTLDSFSVSVIDPSGDGDLAYNNSNGVFTFTPADTSGNVPSDFNQMDELP